MKYRVSWTIIFYRIYNVAVCMEVGIKPSGTQINKSHYFYLVQNQCLLWPGNQKARKCSIMNVITCHNSIVPDNNGHTKSCGLPLPQCLTVYVQWFFKEDCCYVVMYIHWLPLEILIGIYWLPHWLYSRHKMSVSRYCYSHNLKLLHLIVYSIH